MTSPLHLSLPPTGAMPATPLHARFPAAPTRGVVILHEIFGPQPEIARVVERFANAGYAAVAPDLFAGRSLPVCLAQAMQAMASGTGPQIEQIRAARSWLCEQTGLQPAQVGLIGFCLGGGFALAAGSGWGAVSTNYGDVPPSEVMRGIGPVIGCYGGRDLAFRKAPQRLRERLQPLGVEPEIHLYPDVGHSFLTDGHHPIAHALAWPLMRVRYEPATAEAGWREILGFFARHLPAAGPGPRATPP